MMRRTVVAVLSNRTPIHDVGPRSSGQAQARPRRDRRDGSRHRGGDRRRGGRDAITARGHHAAQRSSPQSSALSGRECTCSRCMPHASRQRPRDGCGFRRRACRTANPRRYRRRGRGGSQHASRCSSREAPSSRSRHAPYTRRSAEALATSGPSCPQHNWGWRSDPWAPRSPRSATARTRTTWTGTCSHRSRRRGAATRIASFARAGYHRSSRRSRSSRLAVSGDHLDRADRAGLNVSRKHQTRVARYANARALRARHTAGAPTTDRGLDQQARGSV